MNRWKEQLEGNSIHETLTWLKDSVATIFDDLDEDEVIEKRRFIKLVSLTQEIVDNIDPEITPITSIDSLNSALRSQPFATAIDSYRKSGGVSHLIEANNLFTNQLGPLSQILSFGSLSSTTNQLKEIEHLMDSTSEAIIEKKASLSSELDGIASTADSIKQQLSELSSSIDQKFSEINTQISEWQSQFSSAQESRSQEFNSWRDTFKTQKDAEIDSLIESSKARYSEAQDNLFNQIKELVSDSERKHDAILELYELTAGDSVGAGYMANAQNEKKQADAWRKLSVVFIAVTVCWLVSVYYMNFHTADSISNTTTAQGSNSLENNERLQKNNNRTSESIEFSKVGSSSRAPRTIQWFKILMTFSISGVLLWGSAYAAQQSSKHRRNEKRTRWFALEIKAIDPFINSLDDEQKNQIKTQLSERMFGQHIADNDDRSNVLDEHAYKMVVDGIVKILAKVHK